MRLGLWGTCNTDYEGWSGLLIQPFKTFVSRIVLYNSCDFGGSEFSDWL